MPPFFHRALLKSCQSLIRSPVKLVGLRNTTSGFFEISTGFNKMRIRVFRPTGAQAEVWEETTLLGRVSLGYLPSLLFKV
jgi:hypothetical protein